MFFVILGNRPSISFLFTFHCLVRAFPMAVLSESDIPLVMDLLQLLPLEIRLRAQHPRDTN